MIFVILIFVLIILVCVIIAAVNQSRKASRVQLETLQQQQVQAANAGKPKEDKYDRLAKAKKLLDDGVLTQEEFERERDRILSE